jgi:flagellin
MQSVNTNYGAMIALQNLNKTASELETTQNRINTGMKVSGAKDNAAVFSIAQSMRADVKSYEAVSNSIGMGKSVVDTALAAGEAISDLLTEMKSRAVAASDATLTAAQRTSYLNDFNEMRTQINTIQANASFNGINLINATGTTMETLTNPAGTDAANLTIASSQLTNLTAGVWADAAAALTSVGTIDTALGAVSTTLASLGSRAKALDILGTLTTKVSDALEAGIGNLVDADLAKESAKLQSLQVKQQLGIQALSIANSSTGSILSLFR